MNAKKKNGSGFLVQGSILAMASIISRIIGLIYRLPMTNIIGDAGNNYYSCAFEIYNIMLIISSYSLPLAVSKLVSAKMAKGSRKGAYAILKGALIFAGAAGLVVTLIVYLGADFFTGLLQTPLSSIALRVLAPALLVVAILGVLRGFFQGLGTMVPSAISQVIEQIVNAIVSVWAAYVLFSYGTNLGEQIGDAEHLGPAYGAAGGTLGTNLGAVAGLVFVLFVFFAYMRRFKMKMRRERNVEVDSFGYTMRVLLLTIFPVLLSTTIYNISGILDQGVFKNIATMQGYTSDQIDIWWGVFSGKYKILINVPIAISSAIAASSVPSLTLSYSEGNMESVRSKIHSAMRFISLIAIPCCVGLAVLAKPIFMLLFAGTMETLDMASVMMWIGACAVIFYSISTLSNGLLQGIDKMSVPVKNAAIALVAHLGVLALLMLVFKIHIFAVVIANAFFALLMCFLNARSLIKYSGYKQEFKKTFLLPLLCSLIMGVVALGVYQLFYRVCSLPNAISLFVSIIVAIMVYGFALILLKGITEEEILNFPKGTMLVRILKKMRVFK